MGKAKPKKQRSVKYRAFWAYWDSTSYPLQSLVFLAPLLLIYEVGVRLYAQDSHGVVHIYARTLLQWFFELFSMGNTPYYLPSFIAVGALVVQHILLKKPKWKPEPQYWVFMWIESLILALPLFYLLKAVARMNLPATMAGADVAGQGTWQGQIVLSIGAGIYEELLFRMLIISGVRAVVEKILAFDEEVGMIVAVALSAVAFAVYHFHPGNPFTLGYFVQYTLAGVYFGVIYIQRGFGICVGTHALYDILTVVIPLFVSG